MKTHGFTLIEFMIVIAIITVLTAIAIPALVRKNNNCSEALEVIKAAYPGVKILAATDLNLFRDPSAGVLRWVIGDCQEISLATADAISRKTGGGVIVVLDSPGKEGRSLVVVREGKVVATGIVPPSSNPILDSLKVTVEEKKPPSS